MIAVVLLRLVYLIFWHVLGLVLLMGRTSRKDVELLADGTTPKLCELRWTGSAHPRGFAIYRAGHDDYQESIFPTGQTVGTAKTPSTPPAASTWATAPPGPNPAELASGSTYHALVRLVERE